MRKDLLAGAAAVAFFAFAGGTSLAAELADWSGLYVGGHLGLGDADFHVHSHRDLDDIARPDPDGIVGGIHAGYNWQIPADRYVDWQINTFVLGVEADVSATGWSGADVHPDDSSRSANSNVNLLATLRARLGMTLDRSLLYVTGGLAYTDASTVGFSPDGTKSTAEHDGFGGVVGLGAEWKQTQNLSWRAEWLYYMFFDDDNFGSSTSPSNRSTFSDAWVARLGFTYHFDNFLSGNTRKTAANRHRPDAVASKMAPKKVSQAQPLAGERKPRTEDDAAASMMTPTLVSLSQPLARERKPRTENGAAASMMAPTLVSQASPLARAPKPRTEVVAPAPPREPPRTVVPASTGLDTETRLVKLKVLYDRGLIGDRDYYEKRRQLSSGTSAAKDDLKAAAVQVGPEKKPGEPQPAVKPDDEMVKIVFATPGTRGGEADRGSREYISWVQRSLNQILGTDLDVDGIMGRQTRGAVRSFQTEAGIGVDGTPGHHTEDALIKAGASPPRPG